MNSLIIFCAQYVILAVALGSAVAWLRVSSSAKKQLLGAVILSGVIAMVLSRIASRLYYDPRPFVTEHIQPLIAHAADNGFPSDHALLAMTLTAVTYFFSKKIAAVMLVATVLVSASRVLARVHSPLDIAGAWVIGVVSAVVGFYIVRYVSDAYGRRESPR